MTAKDMGMEATMEIKSNGEMVLDLDGSKSEGNWEEKDGKLIIADDTNTGEEVTPLEDIDGKSETDIT